MSINRETVRLYWQQAKKYKTSFFLALFSVPIGALLIDIALPYFASQAIGSVLNEGTRTAYNFVLLAAIAGLIGAILNYVGFQSLVRHEANVTRALVTSTFESIVHKDSSFFADRKTGAMTSNFINFVHAHVALQDLLIIRTLGFVISIGTGLVLLATHVWQLSALLFIFLVLLCFQVRWSIKRRETWRKSRRKIRSDMHGNIADAITNNLIVRTFAKERSEYATIKRQATAYHDMYRKDIGFVSTEGSIRVLIMSTVQIITIALCVYFVSEQDMSIGIAIFVIAYMQRIGSQLFTLGEMLNGYDQALLDAQPMTEMLLSTNQVADRPNAHQLSSASSGDIRLDSVSYRYSDGTADVLSDISITIPSGQKVGLVGHSGAGKSTIVQLLLRFSDVTAGSITVSGHDIRDITQTSLRENIAYVPQEPLLFHRSLRENIAYGKSDATDDEIILAATQANAWEFISKLSNGLDTAVGERGVKLSGGQRQRIAIARAILKDAPILVLDEATSALDSESEKLIQQSLDTLMQGRTSIVIAHRLSTIARLDRIIVLDNGRVVEDGSHTELLARGGKYASLWHHQSGGFIEE